MCDYQPMEKMNFSFGMYMADFANPVIIFGPMIGLIGLSVVLSDIANLTLFFTEAALKAVNDINFTTTPLLAGDCLSLDETHRTLCSSRVTPCITA